jgi:hypothetical protein
MSVPHVAFKELSTLHISNLIICNVDILNRKEMLVKGKQGREFSLVPTTQLVTHHMDRERHPPVVLISALLDTDTSI